MLTCFKMSLWIETVVGLDIKENTGEILLPATKFSNSYHGNSPHRDDTQKINTQPVLHFSSLTIGEIADALYRLSSWKETRRDAHAWPPQNEDESGLSVPERVKRASLLPFAFLVHVSIEIVCTCSPAR